MLEVPVSSLFLAPTAGEATASGARMKEMTVVLSALFLRPQWRTVFSLNTTQTLGHWPPAARTGERDWESERT